MNTKQRTQFIFSVLVMVLAVMVLMGFGPREAELMVAGGLIVMYFALNAYYSWQDKSQKEMTASIIAAFAVLILMIFYFS